jgi:putative protease
VLADAGCRNTVFNAEAQSAAPHLGLWLGAGVRHFRLEFVHETPAQIAAISGAFRLALSGALSPAALAARLSAQSPAGVTEGSLYVPPGNQELPILL